MGRVVKFAVLLVANVTVLTLWLWKMRRATS